jgi:hypothetical protein
MGGSSVGVGKTEGVVLGSRGKGSELSITAIAAADIVAGTEGTPFGIILYRR